MIFWSYNMEEHVRRSHPDELGRLPDSFRRSFHVDEKEVSRLLPLNRLEPINDTHTTNGDIELGEDQATRASTSHSPQHESATTDVPFTRKHNLQVEDDPGPDRKRLCMLPLSM